MIKAFLFDLDGVIIDSEEPWIFGYKDFLKENGISVDDSFVLNLVGITSHQQLEIITTCFDDSYNLDFVSKMWDEYNQRHPIDYPNRIMPNVFSTFSALKEKGYRIAVVSSSEQSYVEMILGYAKVLDLCDRIFGGDTMLAHKPDPACYLTASRAFELDPNQCVVVEDSVKGIQAGKGAGMQVIARRCDWVDIDQSQADYHISDLKEILNLLDAVNADLTEDDRLLQDTLNYLEQNGRYLEMKQFIAHSDITVYQHCVAVCRKALELCRTYDIKVNKEELVFSCLLHDYYLYDWHINEKGRKLHGTHHQIIAADNAKRDYQISDKIYSIIKTHMFPLPPQYIPKYKEAWVLTWADKIVATKEALKKYKQILKK